MYEAITGMLPFPRVDDDATSADRFPQLYLDPLPFGSDVPPVLAELVMNCLEKRPENRPPQSSIADRLEPFVAVLPRRIVLSKFRPRMG
jgi:hypothetical protein